MVKNLKSGTAVSDNPPRTLSIFLEAGVVAMAGILFALASNALSPRGLMLARDYFPVASKSVGTAESPPASFTKTNTTKLSSGTVTALEVLSARLEAEGLRSIDSNQVVQLFHDPRYEQELFVFIDARDDTEYAKGHIPGAFQFDRYHAENYLATVLPVCQTADRVVVYCIGGDCEDSLFTAVTLKNAGIPGTNLWIYTGGLGEWTTNGLPVEKGARMSGELISTPK